MQIYESISNDAMVILIDERGLILETNDNFKIISGYSNEELLGNSYKIVNSGYHPRKMFYDLWSCVKKNKVWTGEICIKKKNRDHYWTYSTVIPVTGQNGNRHYMVACFDISEKKEADKALYQSSKMASLVDVIGGIAHEINNPLAIIRGRAELVLGQLKQQEAFHNTFFAQKNIDKIIESTVRIENIINSLRTFSRDEENKPFQRIPIKKVIDETLCLCEEKMKNYGFNFYLNIDDCDVDKLSIDCRETQILQVLVNLITNAIDANFEQANKWIEMKVEVYPLTDRLQIRITDSGYGIPEDLQNLIFQPFFTTQELGRRAGLGLSLSKNFIDSHYGEFYIDTKAKNTCFVIDIPVRQSSVFKMSA